MPSATTSHGVFRWTTTPDLGGTPAMTVGELVVVQDTECDEWNELIAALTANRMFQLGLWPKERGG